MSTELSLVSRQMRYYSRMEKPVALEHRGESGIHYEVGEEVKKSLLKVGSAFSTEAPGFVSVHTHLDLTEYEKDGVPVIEIVEEIEETDPELIEAQMNNDEY